MVVFEFHQTQSFLLKSFQLQAAGIRLKAFGYKLQPVAYDEFRAHLRAAAKSTAENALTPLVSHFSDSWSTSKPNPRYDQANVASALAGSGVHCPQIDDVLGVYLTYLIQCGFLPPPVEGANPGLKIEWDKIGEGVAMLTRSGRSATKTAE